MLSWPKVIEGESPEDSVQRVHRWVESIFVYAEDAREWGMIEHWPLRSELEESAARHGGEVHDDCDGRTALCRYALWDLFVPSRIVTCAVETGESHAVLAIEGSTSIMDNRHSRVVTRGELERLGYTWIAISGVKPNDPWTEVKS